MRTGRLSRYAAVAAIPLLVAGCASFSDASVPFSDQATLTPTIATVIPPYGDAALPHSSEGTSPGPSGSSAEPDPCAPPELPIVAVCLDGPVGLAPLPDGTSALVAEQGIGRVLRVAPKRDPEPVAELDGTVTSVVLSPYFVEDQLVYAHVVTDTDSRILRFPMAGDPTPIVTGLPLGGGPIAFGADGLLYVVTGDGEVLRFDGFGAPVGARAYASGLAAASGFCPLPDGRLGVIDHRPTEDALIVLAEGGDYTRLRSGDTLWTYSRGDGGAVDCAVANSALVATSRRDAAAVRIEMGGPDSFTGVPEQVAVDDFGYLDAVATGPGDLVWMTTRNRTTEPALDGFPEASDDRVLVLPPDMGGGGGGID